MSFSVFLYCPLPDFPCFPCFTGPAFFVFHYWLFHDIICVDFKYASFVLFSWLPLIWSLGSRKMHWDQTLETHLLDFIHGFLQTKDWFARAEKKMCQSKNLLQFFVASFLAPSWVVAVNATLATHAFVRKIFCVYCPLLWQRSDHMKTVVGAAVARWRTWADCRTPGGRRQWWCGRGRGGGNAGAIFWPSPPVLCRASLLSPQAAWCANLS